MAKNLQKVIFGVFFVALLTGLTACSRHSMKYGPYLNRTTTGLILGAAGGAALGSISGGMGTTVGVFVGGTVGTLVGADLEKNVPAIIRFEGRLKDFGITVVKLGEEVKIFIPVDRYFYLKSPRLNERGYDALDMIADYLRFYHFISLQVAGYTDDQQPKQRAFSITRAQASSVEDYLWEKHLDVRIIVAKGYGPLYPLAKTQDLRGRAINRRIEISFRSYHSENTRVA